MVCPENPRDGLVIIIVIITLFKVVKNTNVIRVASNKIAAVSIEKR